MKKQGLVAFFCYHSKEILLHLRSDKCRDHHNTWDCGGGAIEPGETPMLALFREIAEEYGLTNGTYIVREKLPVADYTSPDGMTWIVHGYICEILKKNSAFRGEPEKMLDLDWFTLDSLPENIHPGVKQDIDLHYDRIIHFLS